jgi:hypothetical protein
MRFRLFVILIGAALVAVTYSFPLWRPLFVNNVVNEAFPGLSADLQAAFTALTPAEQAAFRQMVATDQAMALTMVEAALQAPTVITPEATPDMQSTIIVADGTFGRIDVIHWAEGTATIYQLPDNRKVLRFESFRSANGPDLRVILSAGEEPRTREEVERGNLNIELGRLKGSIGDQNYEIPAEIDLSLYNSVVIYCQAFHVVFSTAAI